MGIDLCDIQYSCVTCYDMISYEYGLWDSKKSESRCELCWKKIFLIRFLNLDVIDIIIKFTSIDYKKLYDDSIDNILISSIKKRIKKMPAIQSFSV